MYPVQYTAEYVERRSRLSTFFRPLLAIPAALLTMVYGLAASFAVIAAWVAIVFTGRYPEGIYDFVAGYLRNATRLNAYSYLVTDRYPPFNGASDDSYPVQIEIGPPKASYDRLKTLFRLVLIIPVAVIAWVLGMLLAVASFCAWFVIVITGKQPKGLQDMLDLALRYVTRASAYYLLLTETWPPFADPAPQIDGGVPPPAITP